MKRSSLRAKFESTKKPLRDKRGGSLLKQFGGPLLKRGNAKTARHLSAKNFMHIVLRSSLATGDFAFRSSKNRRLISKLLSQMARKYRVQLQEVAIAGEHIQLLIKLPDKKSFHPFIRAITGAIALKITGANKNRGLKDIFSSETSKRFWDFRPWTRIVEKIRTYSIALDHFILINLQKIGVLVNIPKDYHRYFKEAPS